jgi:5'(3')-deoxyribonucleotidase
MEIKEVIFLQLLNKFEEEIIANNNIGQLDISVKSDRNCEEIKNYINQIIEEITSLKE